MMPRPTCRSGSATSTAEYYREITPLLQPLPGAGPRRTASRSSGLQVVLASSAPEDELEILRKVLDCDDVISETTSSRDVDTAKPEPGIVRVALDRAGVDAEHAVFVGDAVWDAQAAAGAETAVHRTAERRHRPRGAAGSGRRPRLRRSSATCSNTWNPPA